MICRGQWAADASPEQIQGAIDAENPCLAFGLSFEVRPIEAAHASAYAVTNETPPGRAGGDGDGPGAARATRDDAQ